MNSDFWILNLLFRHSLNEHFSSPRIFLTLKLLSLEIFVTDLFAFPLNRTKIQFLSYFCVKTLKKSKLSSFILSPLNKAYCVCVLIRGTPKVWLCTSQQIQSPEWSSLLLWIYLCVVASKFQALSLSMTLRSTAKAKAKAAAINSSLLQKSLAYLGAIAHSL